jgi:2-dehydro-3-deoxy-D-arabinonate dehydratase
VQVVRYRERAAAAQRGGFAAGVRENGAVAALPGGLTVGGLLREPLDRIRELIDSVGDFGLAVEDAEIAAPVDGLTEVWAAGVTYVRSRAARVEESASAADVYEQVYAAERPEIFFKSASWRVAGHGEPIQIREDSTVDVPEPELAAVLNAYGEIVGYTVCNDVSSRSIEGENPLYLPQAKVFLGGCAVGPGIRPAWEVGDPGALGMELEIVRAGGTVWQGSANTKDMVRRIEDLAGYLFRAEEFPEGAVLSTGTSLVPDLPFTLQAGDTVTITVEGVGTLSNPVVRGKAGVRLLVDRLATR